MRSAEAHTHASRRRQQAHRPSGPWPLSASRHGSPQLWSSIMRAMSSTDTAADALSGMASSRSASSAPGCARG
eukprot:scaffold120464_cov54-Phaeocystis_antarctica.AAC.1